MGKLTLCDMCIDRLNQGLKPACEVACPAGAIKTFTAKEISVMRGNEVVEKIGKSVNIVNLASAKDIAQT